MSEISKIMPLEIKMFAIILSMERQVEIVRKKYPTFVDALLKIGGFLGILRLFTVALGFCH